MSCCHSKRIKRGRRPLLEPWLCNLQAEPCCTNYLTFLKLGVTIWKKRSTKGTIPGNYKARYQYGLDIILICFPLSASQKHVNCERMKNVKNKQLCRASLVAQLVKNLPAMQETQFNSWVRKICQRRDRLPTPVSLGFPCGSAGKESVCNAGDLGSIPGLGRFPGEGKGYPFQYSCLENPHGQRSLVDYSPWGRNESDTTEQLPLSLNCIVLSLSPSSEF